MFTFASWQMRTTVLSVIVITIISSRSSSIVIYKYIAVTSYNHTMIIYRAHRCMYVYTYIYIYVCSMIINCVHTCMCTLRDACFSRMIAPCVFVFIVRCLLVLLVVVIIIITIVVVVYTL